MRLLIYTLNFAPELTGIGKYSGEMASWLATRGHEVRVVTAPPYYPKWEVSPGYSGSSYKREEWQGVQVQRCPLWVPKRVTGIKRLIHLASFAASSLPVLLAQVRWRPDVVWVVEPALFCTPGALLAAKLCGARTWLHVQDFEVDAAFEMGLLKSRGLRSAVSGFERWLMRRFDRVSTISRQMLKRLLDKGVNPDRTVSFPNWVDITGIAPLANVSPYRSELNIPPGSIVALYSGNMGAKQGLEVLASAAHKLRQESGIVFVFCGDGAAKADLQGQCGGLTNVRMLPLQPLDRLNELLGLADIHLLPQRADAADLVLPSKLTGMLASGRAVLVTAAPGTELAQVVESSGCGMVVPPEDPDRLAAAVMQLASDARVRASMGAAGRTYAERELDVHTILERFEGALRG
ncbi:MAG: glycosyl transferase [Ramlibacter sp.]|nr:glycosyl transferase [Ramlibacter sp.]